MNVLNLKGLHIAVIGGDIRDVVLANELAGLGASVWLHGFTDYTGSVNTNITSGLPHKADALILPLPGILPDDTIYALFSPQKIYVKDLESLLLPGTLVLCGQISEKHHDYFSLHQIKVLETGKLEEVAIYNAIPTAEGAVEFALRHSPVTIFGSKVLVAGFGRCAQPLACNLKALGANVTIAARNRKAIASAKIQNLHTIALNELVQYVDTFDFIFNTIPALVFTRNVLDNVRQDALIIDIASAPGGVDFEEAEKKGLNAHLLPGLPGKTAPLSAGKILAGIYPYYLSMHRKGGKYDES